MENPAGPAAIETSNATMPPQPLPQVPTITSSQPSSTPPNQTPGADSQLENLCKTMYGEGLLRYIASKLVDTNNTLREQLPNALKLAPNAAKLVLSCCLGNFSLMVDASVLLVLECFLLMDFDEIDQTLKEEAEKVAVTWRERLVNEGFLKNASEKDARRILLLIGCFGIPEKFKNEDVIDLLMVSNIKEISTALRKSNVLMAKIPEIIESMVEQKMEVDAVDVVYTFRVEEKYSPRAILSSFLQEFKESLKRRRCESSGQYVVVDETNREELATLKYIVKCLEGHNIDPSKLITKIRISDRIISLEKKIGRHKSRRDYDRKFDDTGLSESFEHREAKRSRIPGSEQQRAVNNVQSHRTLLEGGTASHTYGYTLPPSVLPAPIASSIPETVAGNGGSVVIGGVGPRAGSYGWQSDASMHGRMVPHNYRYGPSPQWQGSVVLPNTPPVGIGYQTSTSDAYQFTNAVPGSAPHQNSAPHAIGSVPFVNHHSPYFYPPGTYYPQGMH